MNCSVAACRYYISMYINSREKPWRISHAWLADIKGRWPPRLYRCWAQLLVQSTEAQDLSDLSLSRQEDDSSLDIRQERDKQRAERTQKNDIIIFKGHHELMNSCYIQPTQIIYNGSKTFFFRSLFCLVGEENKMVLVVFFEALQFFFGS